MNGNSQLKKVIILTYFFPPGNFAGSYRLFSWARYLHKFGFYPIIITRHWEKDQTDYAGISQKKEIEVQKFDHYEVHSIPYNGNLRDKIKAKYGNKVRLLTKFLSLVELVFQNFFTPFIPSRKLYYYAKEFLEKNHDVRYLIASGKPYILFKFGHNLKQQFPYLRWIADYRDPWNTHWWLNTKMPLILKSLEPKSEKRWLSNADAFITCSEEWAKDIHRFVRKKGFVVLNGYEEEDKNLFINRNNSTETFSIIHNGSVYGLHNIDIFIKSIKTIIDKGYDNILVQFPGINIDEKEGERLRHAIVGYEKYFLLSGRIPRPELINQICTSQLLIVFGTKEMSGWYPLKLFEYLIAGKPILHCPGDDDVITNMIHKTNTGFVTYTIDQTVEVLENLYCHWQNKQNVDFSPNQEVISQFSRLAQTNELAEGIATIDKTFSVPLVPVSKFRERIFKTAFNIKIHSILRASNLKTDTLVLCFHDISDIPNPSYPSLSPEQFEKIIDYLANSYEFTTIENIKNGKTSNITKVLLTFDDGYKSFITNVVPVLKKHNASAICSVIVDTIESGQRFWTDRLNASLNYIVSNYPSFNYSYNGVGFEYDCKKDKPNRFSSNVFNDLLEKQSEFRSEFVSGIEKKLGVDFEWTDNFMNWNDVNECIAEGMIFASHSRTHNILSTISNDNELNLEIESSKQTIESKTGKPISIFTCPNGIYDERVFQKAQTAGYDIMFTTKEQKVNPKDFKNGLTILPRISVDKSSFEENIFKINNFFAMLKGFNQ